VLWAQTFKRPRRRTSSFYCRAVPLHPLPFYCRAVPSTPSHTTHITRASPARLKTREMACVLPWVYTVILNREVTCSCCSRVTSTEGRPLYKRGYLYKLRMKCIFVFLWVPPAIADREEKLFVTWVSTVTLKRQELLWCRCWFSSVAALKVSMDCHILVELDSDATDEIRHFVVVVWTSNCRKKGNIFDVITSLVSF
jgi:hypothetical protein